MVETVSFRAAEAGVRTMTLGAEETARLAAEGIESTDDSSKFTCSSAVGDKVGHIKQITIQVMLDPASAVMSCCART